MGLPDSLRIHESEQVVGELADGERGGSPRHLPVSTGIQGEDVPGPGELVDLPLEIIAVLTVSMWENQRLSMPLLYEIVLYVSVVAFVQFAFNLVQRVEEPFRGDGRSTI